MKLTKEQATNYYSEKPYNVMTDPFSGSKYVDVHSVRSDCLNVSDGNSKTGDGVGNYNLPIYGTCVCNCECHAGYIDENGKHVSPCYACTGLYNMPDNQRKYAENLAYFNATDSEAFVNEMVSEILNNKWELYRYFTIGDIPNMRFFECMVEIARRLENVTRFWFYTKKYGIVNLWVQEHGLDAIPENLTVIFSHWRNHDGSFYPMSNPYNFPTSEFIPAGMENEIDDTYHVCPCSDPTFTGTCKTCEKPCHELKHGEHMALKEHSTSATKQRDKEIHASQKALKDAEKKARKAEKKARKVA